MGFFSKKSLGQNFLRSEKVVSDIVAAAHVSEDDVILEIGPGKGVLTRALLKHARHVVAVEKDRRLIKILEETFADDVARGALTLIHEDALLCEPSSYKLSATNPTQSLVAGEYKIVANIPYYITGALLEKFLASKTQPSHMTLLIQKEVADRIMARDGKESILSISVKAFGEPVYHGKVSRHVFSPQPNVDSAILSIEHISRDFFETISEKDFFSYIHAGFRHKRKLLMRSLETLASPETLRGAFITCAIAEKARPEELSVGAWKCLIESTHSK